MKYFKILFIIMMMGIISTPKIFAQEGQENSRKKNVSGAYEFPKIQNWQNNFGVKLSPALAGTVVVGTTWKESVRALGKERIRMSEFFRRGTQSNPRAKAASVAKSLDVHADTKVIAGDIKVSAGNLSPAFSKEIFHAVGVEKMTKLVPDAATLQQVKDVNQVARTKVKPVAKTSWTPSELKSVKS